MLRICQYTRISSLFQRSTCKKLFIKDFWVYAFQRGCVGFFPLRLSYFLRTKAKGFELLFQLIPSIYNFYFTTEPLDQITSEICRIGNDNNNNNSQQHKISSKYSYSSFPNTAQRQSFSHLYCMDFQNVKAEFIFHLHLSLYKGIRKRLLIIASIYKNLGRCSKKTCLLKSSDNAA